MDWFVLALLTAFFSASEAAWLKRFLAGLRPMEMAAYPVLYALPLFSAGLLVIPTPEIQPGFWWAVAALLPLNILGYALHMRAIHESPISLTMPLLAFTPAFVILTGFLLLDELPSLFGAAGILGIVAGSYLLGVGGATRRLLDPVRAVWGDRGARFMLGAALAYAFCGVVGKLMVLKSAPMFAGMLFFVVFALVFVPLALLTRQARARALVAHPLPGLGIGVIFGLHIVCHHAAIALTQASYMMAVKRLNGLISVLYGGMLLGEGRMGFKLAGAALMALGAACLALFG